MTIYDLTPGYYYYIRGVHSYVFVFDRLEYTSGPQRCIWASEGWDIRDQTPIISTLSLILECNIREIRYATYDEIMEYEVWRDKNAFYTMKGKKKKSTLFKT